MDHLQTATDGNGPLRRAGPGTAPAGGRDRSGLRALAHDHPAALFITLALGISWLVWVPSFATDSNAQWPIFLGAFGPAVAGAAMTRLRGGAVRAWLRSILRFRVRARWYAAALALPLIDPVIQAVLAAQAGVPLSPAGLIERMPLYVSSFVLVLLVGGGQEEFGWRGWLLPQLQRRTSPVTASLLLGGVHAVWHLPLFAFGAATYGDTVFALYAPHLLAASVVFTWLYNSGRASVVIAILLHTQTNVASALVPVTDLAQYQANVAEGTVSTPMLQAVLAAAWAVIAAALIWRDRRLGLRADSAAEVAAGAKNCGRTSTTPRDDPPGR